MQGTLAVAKNDNVLSTITISLSCKLDPCSQVEKLSFSPDLCFGARIDISESVWAYANSWLASISVRTSYLILSNDRMFAFTLYVSSASSAYELCVQPCLLTSLSLARI